MSPLKDEHTPSFSVNEEKQSFYDFSSGKGGHLIQFIMDYERCSFPRALEKLKAYAGYAGEVTKHHALDATSIAKQFAPSRRKQEIPQNKPLQDDYMERFEIVPEKLAVWEQEGIPMDVMRDFDVRYDRLSDRLVYPIRDLTGKIVNVGGRTLDPEWKAKKLRKYTYFMPWDGGMNLIYGLFESLNHVKAARSVILFEGVKSVMLARAFGVYNTGALLTSHVSNAQLHTLIGLGVRVVFALDKDVNIRDDKNIKKLKQFVNVEYLWDGENLLDEKDSPTDQGAEVFQRLYEGRYMWK